MSHLNGEEIDFVKQLVKVFGPYSVGMYLFLMSVEAIPSHFILCFYFYTPILRCLLLCVYTIIGSKYQDFMIFYSFFS